MTREARFFQVALGASLVLHAVLLTLFIALPGGGPAEPVQLYTVRILEAPSRPEARELSLSTDAISALKLESPSLRADAPPLPEPAGAEVPDVERFPQSSPPPDTARTTAPSLTPPTPTAPSVVPELAAPAAPAAPPRLPGLPAAPAAPSAAPSAPAAPPSAPALLPPSAPVVDEPVRQSAMERLRSKVQTLNLEVEAQPSERPSAVPQPQREQNVLSLRMYSNRVREAVKEQYTFPGGFDASLRARVRVVLNRDGTVRSRELLESSGNGNFDRLVCMAAFDKAKIPPIPQGLEADGETLTLLFTCSP